ncbi:hypothetical protein A2524_02415 [Candidatus Wolfebacteria bacterium RIFOXYD12_FULL_48_21]|uniref:RNA polymerase sigma factor n=1 Tax=Candidatus Wolfebacteria bacterium RIFOXYD1_FULL_48_65 TaxID=1802561 RepID=A0A1F8E3E4_9BACT|nr:MAG: hypothetical protein A2524_02415 [Candidatus Wolfebacteria bacterium RIFOXYD12_FULL_48_21]OGM94819.1 MAG: hypothetical protein A2610_04130 [Candidatus Wolfebacteria bacterium RIFOXYD1_FULL_48_65]OGM95720.1 MAG: hypothetical protein A2532_03695 [Candidatus Wolfebacteria bacterium RIFOXYD2_FULL_48_11]
MSMLVLEEDSWIKLFPDEGRPALPKGLVKPRNGEKTTRQAELRNGKKAVSVCAIVAPVASTPKEEPTGEDLAAIELDDMGEDPDGFEELSEEDGEELEVAKVSASTQDPLQYYLHELRNYPLLTPPEEFALALKKEAGCAASKKQLVERNLRLVIMIAKRYLYRGLPLEDLIQEGNAGLMRAAEKFSTSFDCKFATYATWWIHQAIKIALKNKTRPIRLPAHVEELLSWRMKATASLIEKLGRKPDTEEMIEEITQLIFKNSSIYAEARKTAFFTDIAIKRLRASVRRMERAYAQTKMYSLDTEVGEDGTTMIDFVASSKPNPEDILGTEEINRKLVEPALAILTEQQRHIMRQRFGFDGEEKTLEELGEVYGVTRERIRQIELIAMRRLCLYFQREKRIGMEAMEAMQGAR